MLIAEATAWKLNCSEPRMQLNYEVRNGYRHPEFEGSEIIVLKNLDN